MKFKIGDRVRVTHADTNWLFWMPQMNSLVGGVHTIVGEWKSISGIHPTIVVPGACLGLNGINREEGEYGFPEHCLELAIKPGEQLLFSFMEEV
jgi:hypothetical protein